MRVIKIRKGVFETNSSSSHSLTIESTSFLMDSLIPEQGVVTIEPGEFGWEWKRFNDAETKASYCLTGALYVADRETALNNLREVIQAQTLCNEVVLIEPSDDWDSPNYGSIDHQSWEDGQFNDLLFDKEELHNFIFNKNSWLFLGNDNSYPPNKFYDTTGLPYKWKITFPDYPSITQWEFINYPSEEEILKAINEMNLRFMKVWNGYEAQENFRNWSSSNEYFEFSSRDSKVENNTISFFSDKDKSKNTILLVNYQMVEIEK